MVKTDVQHGPDAIAYKSNIQNWLSQLQENGSYNSNFTLGYQCSFELQNDYWDNYDDDLAWEDYPRYERISIFFICLFKIATIPFIYAISWWIII